MDRRPRVDWGVMGGELIVACAVWVFFYWLWLGLYGVRPGHLGDILFARVLVPAAIPLFLLVQIHETWNHASVVFNDESISKATWLGSGLRSDNGPPERERHRAPVYPGKSRPAW